MTIDAQYYDPADPRWLNVMHIRCIDASHVNVRLNNSAADYVQHVDQLRALRLPGTMAEDIATWTATVYINSREIRVIEKRMETITRPDVRNHYIGKIAELNREIKAAEYTIKSKIYQ